MPAPVNILRDEESDSLLASTGSLSTDECFTGFSDVDECGTLIRFFLTLTTWGIMIPSVCSAALNVSNGTWPGPATWDLTFLVFSTGLVTLYRVQEVPDFGISLRRLVSKYLIPKALVSFAPPRVVVCSG